MVYFETTKLFLENLCSRLYNVFLFQTRLRHDSAASLALCRNWVSHLVIFIWGFQDFQDDREPSLVKGTDGLVVASFDLTAESVADGLRHEQINLNAARIAHRSAASKGVSLVY